jgi:hypothetical protein
MRLTLMQSARDLAAAARGGGARVSEANVNSKIGSGEVMKRRRWLAIDDEISGKLEVNRKQRDVKLLPVKANLCTRTVTALRAAS